MSTRSVSVLVIMDLGDQGPAKRRLRGKRGAKDGRGNEGGTSKAFHSSSFLEAGSAVDPYARRKELQEKRKVMMQTLLKEKPVEHRGELGRTVWTPHTLKFLEYAQEEMNELDERAARCRDMEPPGANSPPVAPSLSSTDVAGSSTDVALSNVEHFADETPPPLLSSQTSAHTACSNVGPPVEKTPASQAIDVSSGTAQVDQPFRSIKFVRETPESSVQTDTSQAAAALHHKHCAPQLDSEEMLVHFGIGKQLCDKMRYVHGDSLGKNSNDPHTLKSNLVASPRSDVPQWQQHPGLGYSSSSKPEMKQANAWSVSPLECSQCQKSVWPSLQASTSRTRWCADCWEGSGKTVPLCFKCAELSWDGWNRRDQKWMCAKCWIKSEDAGHACWSEYFKLRAQLYPQVERQPVRTDLPMDSKATSFVWKPELACGNP